MDFHRLHARNSTQPKGLLGHIQSHTYYAERCFSSRTPQNTFIPSIHSNILSMTEKLVSDFCDNPNSTPKVMLNKIAEKTTSDNVITKEAFIVGGFVGSKSQAGVSHGSHEYSLWDIILDKIQDMVLHSQSKAVHFSYSSDSSNSAGGINSLPLQREYSEKRHSLLRTNRCILATNCIEKELPLRALGQSEMSLFGYSFGLEKLKLEKELSKGSKPSLLCINDREHSLMRCPSQENERISSTCDSATSSTCAIPVREALRTLSECSLDSEDSFIVFEPADGESVISEDFYETDSSSDESEIEEVVDQPFSNACTIIEPSPRIEAANQRWNSISTQAVTKKVTNLERKVKFAEGNKLLSVRRIVVWDFAHRAARKGPWEMIARDTERFRTRIEQLSSLINFVLSQAHRDKIYQERFATT